MSIAGRLDDRLRQSYLARFVPFLKARAPAAYAWAQRVRKVVLPMPSPVGLDRYQLRAVDHFAERMTTPWASARILELGSDTAGKVMTELRRRGARVVAGVNPEGNAHGSDDGRVCRLRADARSLPFADGSFTSIFSVALLEHLLDLDRALAEMHRVLAPGGFVYADFGPIWSSSVGHHVYAAVGEHRAHHWDPLRNPVPHYAHLLMDRAELRAAVESRAHPSLIDPIVEWIFESPHLNRVFYEDFVKSFERSPFVVEHLEPVQEHVPGHLHEALRSRHPGYARFDVRQAEVVLRKSDAVHGR